MILPPNATGRRGIHEHKITYRSRWARMLIWQIFLDPRDGLSRDDPALNRPSGVARGCSRPDCSLRISLMDAERNPITIRFPTYLPHVDSVDLRNEDYFSSNRSSPTAFTFNTMQASNGVNGLKTPLMLQLSESLAKDVASLTRYLDSVGHGQPSWERTIPINVLPPDAPTDIQIARESIMDTAMQLLQLAAGPAQYNNNIKNEVRVHPPTAVSHY